MLARRWHEHSQMSPEIGVDLLGKITNFGLDGGQGKNAHSSGRWVDGV